MQTELAGMVADFCGHNGVPNPCLPPAPAVLGDAAENGTVAGAPFRGSGPGLRSRACPGPGPTPAVWGWSARAELHPTPLSGWPAESYDPHYTQVYGPDDVWGLPIKGELNE